MIIWVPLQESAWKHQNITPRRFFKHKAFSPLGELKSTLKNINYYHGSSVNGLKSLSRGEEYSTPDKKRY
jgi:hypothetical protein